MIVRGLILMTALPPTKGHRHLVDFAVEYMKALDHGDWELHVIVNSRPNEPIRGMDRYAAIRDTFRDQKEVFVHLHNVNMPQEPADHPEFWAIWRRLMIDKLAPYTDAVEYVFASEEYGDDLAKELNATFVPCDIYREINKVHATKVRDDLLHRFDSLLPAIQPLFRKTITIFGPESTGKTTMAKALSEYINGDLVPEWARGYLELKSVGAEVTAGKMVNIARAQCASQEAVAARSEKPFIIRDTDLYSTLGYHLIWNETAPHEVYWRADKQRADLYIVMNDGIPFTHDPLRYGGDKRESQSRFWLDLLARSACKFYEVQSLDPRRQLEECAKACVNFFNSQNNIRFDR